MLYLAVATDIFHALLMVLWIGCLPLLFWRKYPTLSLVYSVFSIAFIIVNVISFRILGECIFTTIANRFYSAANSNAPNEWFSVRLTKLIFNFVPSHKLINVITEGLIFVSSVGVLYSLAGRKAK